MAAKAKYSATTRQILVTVSPTYLEDQSVPENSHFVWAYHVVIQNAQISSAERTRSRADAGLGALIPAIGSTWIRSRSTA